jgi:hypothetical protein
MTLGIRFALSISKLSLYTRQDPRFIHNSIRINHYIEINNGTAFWVQLNSLPTSDLLRDKWAQVWNVPSYSILTRPASFFTIS